MYTKTVAAMALYSWIHLILLVKNAVTYSAKETKQVQCWPLLLTLTVSAFTGIF